MNKHQNSYDTICSSGTSHAETEIEHVIISVSNEHVNLSNSELSDNNVAENNQPNSSGNITPVINLELNNQHGKTTPHAKIDKNTIDIILQHTLHRPTNVLLNLDFENTFDQTPKVRLNHAKNFHRITRSGRGVVLEETVSSNSSSEDSITLNPRIASDRENCEIRNPPIQVNRRLQGVASDTNIIALCRTASVSDLIHTRSEIRVDTNVEVGLAQIRDANVRPQEPIVRTQLHRENNRVGLEAVPETSRNGSTSSRSTFRGSRILKYYRSLRSSVSPDSGIGTSIAQQTSPQSYNTAPPLTEAPPTYSAVIRDEDTDDTIIFVNRNVVGVQQSPQFVAPRPPPTYAEAEGVNIERPMFLAPIYLLFQLNNWCGARNLLILYVQDALI